MPKLSVIVPVFNSEQFLKPCVESILNQDFFDLEVILVDDGSTDHSPELCDKLKESDQRIRVIHQPNQGTAAARNIGLDFAKGDWIAFVDSDDTIDHDMYPTLFHAVENCSAALAMCSIKYIDINGAISRVPSPPHYINSDEIEQINSVQMISEMRWRGEYNNNLFVIVCNKIFRRDILIGKRFRKEVICEDEAFANTLYLNDYPVVIVHKPMYNYRQNPESKMHQQFTRERIVILDVLKERKELFESHGFTESAHVVSKEYSEIYIELYFKCLDVDHIDWILPYYEEWKKIRRTGCAQHLPFISKIKFECRMILFSLSPQIYGRLFRK